MEFKTKQIYGFTVTTINGLRSGGGQCVILPKGHVFYKEPRTYGFYRYFIRNLAGDIVEAGSASELRDVQTALRDFKE